MVLLALVFHSSTCTCSGSQCHNWLYILITKFHSLPIHRAANMGIWGEGWDGWMGLGERGSWGNLVWAPGWGSCYIIKSVRNTLIEQSQQSGRYSVCLSCSRILSQRSNFQKYLANFYTINTVITILKFYLRHLANSQNLPVIWNVYNTNLLKSLWNSIWEGQILKNFNNYKGVYPLFLW